MRQVKKTFHINQAQPILKTFIKSIKQIRERGWNFWKTPGKKRICKWGWKGAKMLQVLLVFLQQG